MNRTAQLEEVLGSIIADLPAKRDWLDPVLERRARALISKAAKKSPVSNFEDGPLDTFAGDEDFA